MNIILVYFKKNIKIFLLFIVFIIISFFLNIFFKIDFKFFSFLTNIIVCFSSLLICSKFKKLQNDNLKLLNQYLIFSSLKVLLLLVYIVFYVIFFKKHILFFISYLFTNYIVFLVLEVSIIIKNIKSNS